MFRKAAAGRLGTWVAFIGLAANTAGITLRWAESYQMGFGHAPLSNLYESLIFFAWTVIVIYLYIEWRYRNRAIGAFSTPIAFLTMAYASLSPNISDRIQPLQFKAEAVAAVPIRRFLEAEEIAELVAYVASDAARVITEQAMNICGGQTMA